MPIEIRPVGRELHEHAIEGIATALGFVPSAESIELSRGVPEFDTRFVAYDGATPVGGVASFSVEVTVPGGAAVPSGALTAVGVLPTHRRQGALTGMMRAYIDGERERGRRVATLWASEGAIYGRFGYGLASFEYEAHVARPRSAFVPAVSAERADVAGVRARRVDQAEALRVMPGVYDRVRARTPGVLSRSAGWWTNRRLTDVEWARRGAGALQRVVFEGEGVPEAYALYRHHGKVEGGVFGATLQVIEAVGTTPRATRALWRYLCDVDLVEQVDAGHLPMDHPLLALAVEPRRLGLRLIDALWVRLIEVAPALAQRGYASDEVLVFDVRDAFCPWNTGRVRLDTGARTAERAEHAAPDLRLDVTALGAVYLGGFSFRQLHAAGRVEELAAGAVARADRAFATAVAPWCVELF